MRQVNVGGDLGKDVLKLVWGSDKYDKVYLKNAVRPAMRSEKRSNYSSELMPLESLDVFIECEHLPELNNRRFYVGELALAYEQQQTSNRVKKMDNYNLLVPFLTLLAMQSKKNDEEIEVFSVLGLPVNEYKNETRRNEYVQKINGTYQVTFIDTPHRQGWKTTIHLQAACDPEGLSALKNQLESRSAEERNQYQGVIDIGASTVDIPVVNTKGEPDSTLTRGIDRGIVTIFDEIAETLSIENGVDITRQDVSDGVLKGEYSIQTGRTQIKIDELMREQLTILSEMIFEKVLEIISMPRGRKVMRFFVCGGGSFFVQPFLKKLVEQLPVEFIFFENFDDAVFQNAYGNYNKAVSLKARQVNFEQGYTSMQNKEGSSPTSPNNNPDPVPNEKKNIPIDTKEANEQVAASEAT